jgi:hypothetical protein
MKLYRSIQQILSITLVLSLTLGCGFLNNLTSTPAPNQVLPTLSASSSPGIASLSNSSVADLADQITRDDASLIQSFEAVQEALARGGIATVDEKGTYVAAYLPASPMPDTHPNILGLTLEVRDRENSYRMTVNEFAKSLSDLGWPFRPTPSNGEQLVDFIAAWVKAAGEDPSDPQSFTPLFLAEMAKHQIPAVDLASGDADSTQAQLSRLELQLFSAAFDRIMIFPQSSNPPGTGGIHLASLSMVKTTRNLSGDDPCTTYKKIFYGPLSSLVLPLPLATALSDFGVTYAVGEAMNKLMERYGISGDEFGKAMAAANVFSRISKLVEIYSSLSITVSVVGSNPVHRPLEGEEDVEVDFDAKVGVSEQDWADYQQKYGELGMVIDRAARDCLANLGIPTMSNASDVAKAIEGVAVEWRIDSGSPANGHDSPIENQPQNCDYHQVRLRCSLSSDSDHSGKSSFRIMVIPSSPPETQKVHENGTLESTSMKVCAAADASEAPSLSTFINGAMGGVGIADPIAELAAGMILKLGKPENCAKLGVTYHVQKGWKVASWNNVSLPGYNFVWTGGLSCDSPYGPWVFQADGTSPQGAVISQTFTIPFSEGGNVTATQHEHLTMANPGMVGDYIGNPIVIFTKIPEGYRMDFASFRMTGSTCVTNNPCFPYDVMKNAWSANIVPADPGQCNQP